LEAGKEKNDSIRRCGLAVVATIFALWPRQLLVPLLGVDNPYHTAWAAVVFSAWYCGVGPSILTALLSVLGVWYWFVPPFGSFGIQDPKTAISGMVGFLGFSGLIIALGEANRRTVLRIRWTEDQLRKAHDELDRRVQERTADLNLANDNLGELSSRLQQIRDEERQLPDAVM
jgi:K+-sensing histidine kinase KdpD